MAAAPVVVEDNRRYRVPIKIFRLLNLLFRCAREVPPAAAMASPRGPDGVYGSQRVVKITDPRANYQELCSGTKVRLNAWGVVRLIVRIVGV